LAESISHQDASNWSLDLVQLATLVREDNPTPISGCRNVWCLSGIVDDHLALINIVQTVLFD
jgi:hypothetical protein